MSIASMTFEFMTLSAFTFAYFSDNNFYYIVLIAALYPLISFYRHRDNIERLLAGDEPKLWGNKKDKKDKKDKTE